MSLDVAKNFAKVEVSIGYDASATAIVLKTGDGAKLPQPSSDGEFNLVWWDSTNYSNPTEDPNVEIVRVTARSTDTLTIVRNQESTGASTKNTADATYKMIMSWTKKAVDDLNQEGSERKSTGAISGGAITDNGGLTINIASGVAYVVQDGLSKRVTWDAFSNQATNDDDINFIAIDKTGALDISTTEQDHDQYVLLGVVFTADSDIVEIHNSPWEAGQIIRKQTQFAATQGENGNIVLSGGITTINGANNKKLDVSNFVGFHLYKKFTLNGATPITFTYWRKDGSGGWTPTTAQQEINTSQYDDGDGTLADLTADYWRADELFITGPGNFHMVIGQAEYPSKNTARISPIADAPDFLNSSGVAWHLFRIVVKEGSPAVVQTLDYRRKDLQIEDRLNWNAKVDNPLGEALNCNNQDLQNVVIETVDDLGTASVFPGRLRRLSTDGKLYASNGTIWVNLMGGSQVRTYISFGSVLEVHSP